MSKGECQTKNVNEYDNEDELNEPPSKILDEGDIALLKTYGLGPYSRSIKSVEDDIKKVQQSVNDLVGIKESDTGLSIPSQWDLVSDKQMLQEEQPLQVARCTKIINAGEDDAKYMINVKQIAKFVVGLGEKVAPTDIEEGMRVGVDRTKYAIQIPLPPKIDPTVSLMTVEDKPDVTYDDVGGCKDSLEKLREVVELPLLHPERFVNLGIDPPKGVLLYGPPGTGKTLSARAVANRTDACFIRVIGSELVQKYVGEGARMVRELFTMARSKKACIVFFDEVDAIGGARSSGEEGGTDNEVQRTMLQIVTELDGFDPRGNIKVLMATNRPDTLDPALMRPGRLDRKVEFTVPELEGRTQILQIHAKSMSCDRNIRFELIARLCPNTTGTTQRYVVKLRSVCTEAGMYAIRARRKSVSEKDFLESVNKVIKGYQKFSCCWKCGRDLMDTADAAEILRVHADDDHHGELCMYKSGKCSEKRSWKNGKQLKLCDAHRLEQNAIKMRSDKGLSMRRKAVREEKKRIERMRHAEERKKMYLDASWTMGQASGATSEDTRQIVPWNGPFVDIGDDVVTAMCLHTLERLGNDVLVPLYEQHPELDDGQKIVVMKVAMVELHKKMMQQLLHMEQAGWIHSTTTCLFYTTHTTIISMAFPAPSALFVAAIAIAASASDKFTNGIRRHLEQSGSVPAVIVSFKKSHQEVLASVPDINSATSRGAHIASIRQALVAHAKTSHSDVLAALHAFESTTETSLTFDSLWASNVVYITNPSESLLNTLAAIPSVDKIRPAVTAHLPPIKIEQESASTPHANEWGVDVIGAANVWASGNKGKGVVVGGIDTGVRGTHEALKTNFRADHGWFDPYHNNTAPVDMAGHGSHTMGTSVGTTGVGVAPEASWIACLGCDDQDCPEYALLKCGEFMLCPTDVNGNNPDCTKAAHVVNNSWGSNDASDTFYDATIAAWRKANIIPVFANGNAGPKCSTVGSPGQGKLTFGIGATQKTDAIASFSSRGPAPDGRIKPDISAPGQSIRSSVPTSDTSYAVYSGTSMATPHVTGAVALILAAKPGVTYDQIYKAFISTTDTVSLTPTNQTCGGVSELQYPNNVYGYGRLNIERAIASLSSSTPSPTTTKPAC
ncbi:hypothetical protein DYB25_001955 [Aphanomyces astaci]|uniref:subtilisin n=2 Tax=Aphanomyces astaci TaxID=112090 RepID=A0A397AUW1_APHAT|nr:hypothetical protein DYB25_001955 [Aphanomyces astaci]